MTTTPAHRAITSTDLAVRSIHAMASGERREFTTMYHPDARDLENPVQPPTSRVPGPDGFWSTAQWLRAAFDGLHYEIHHAIAADAIVAVSSTMCGTHTAAWAVYAPDGSVESVFPPTGKTFHATQSHWFRVEDGLLREHWANRDDLGMSRQLGWVPPTPRYLLRMTLAKRRARHHVD